MSQTGDSIHATLRALCPRVCTNCDYALEGLPVPATCPECGTVEEPTVITLAGWTQPPAALMNRWGKAWMIVGYVMMTLYLLSELMRGRGGRTFVLFWFAAVIAPIFYSRVVAFFKGVEGAPMRLRLSPAGFEKRVGPGPLQLRPWRGELNIVLRPQGKQFWSLQSKWGGEHFAFVSTQNFFVFYFVASEDAAYQLQHQVKEWVAAHQVRT